MGFGGDHDSELLAHVARETAGTYAFVEVGRAIYVM
jgi:hypothetical protein